MERGLRSRIWNTVSVLLVAAVAVLLVSACAPDANASIISPQLGVQLAAQEAGQDIVAVPTEPPPLLASLSEEEIYAGVPEDLAAAIKSADPAGGQIISTANGCIGCHNLDPAAVMTGPTWHNVGDVAVARVSGQSPAEYLHQSIVNPGAHQVPNYPANIMPATYADTLSTENLATLIAYLLAQNGNP